MFAPQDDLTLEKIDFEWVNAQTKIAPLKKALKLLELDGNYYVELIRRIEERMAEIDPKFKKVDPAHIDPAVQQAAKKEVEKWIETPQPDKNQKLAEEEKNKGNDALRSNDLREALNYYSKSIEYDNRMAASYCNRALVYLKLKEYDKVIKDCSAAIGLQADYLKAFHRRGKAYFALKEYEKAYLDFKYIVEKEPENSEVNGELRECRKHLSEQQINAAENKQYLEQQGGFRNVKIVEEDDDGEEEEMEIPMNKEGTATTKARRDWSKEVAEVTRKKNAITEIVKRGMYAQAIEEIVALLKENQMILEQESVEDFIQIRAQLLSNLAYCHSQQQEFSKVIEYCSLLVTLDPPHEVLVKAHLRRAMAYERIEKLGDSKFDYMMAKQLDPSNMQASQGLRRVSEHLSEKENQVYSRLMEQAEKEREKKSKQGGTKKAEGEAQKPQQQQQKQSSQKVMIEEKQEKTLKYSIEDIQKELAAQKDKGNDHFRKGELQQAIDAWQLGIQFFENNSAPTAIQNYLNLLTNSCLCLSQLNQHERVVELASKAISHDPNNLKALFRRGVAYQQLANAEQELLRQNDLLELARKDLDKLVYLDSQNKQAQEKQAEVTKQNVECRVKVKLWQAENEKAQKGPKAAAQPEQGAEQQAEQPQGAKAKGKPLAQQQIEQMGANLTQNVIKELLAKQQQPETASVFEKNMIAFKKGSAQQTIDYVYQITSISQIYSKKDLPIEILLQVMEAARQVLDCEESRAKIKGKIEFSKLEIFGQRFPSTGKFHLCAMQLSKKEKPLMRALLEQVGLHDKLELYKV